MTKIVYKRPPFWRILKIFFPEYDPAGTVSVAFGRTIYTNGEIPKDYLVHEKQHLKQHCHSYTIAVLWWIMYCLSKSFRYSQERDAFRTQYKWIVENEPWTRARKIVELAKGLSSPLYGSMVDERQAQKELLMYE